MPRRDDDDDSGAIWDALGRGTAAGRAVFNLYNGDCNGKAYGSFANEFNRRQMACSDPSTRRLAPAVEEALKKDEHLLSSKRLSAAKVRHPRNFKGRPDPTDEEAEALAFAAARRVRPSVRPRAVIDRENARAPVDGPPAPTRRLIGEAGKLRFQRLREFNGTLPEENPALRATVSKPNHDERSESEVARMERMFDTLAGEIDERETFLDTMRGAGRADEFETHIRAEIAERVHQLRRLDRYIRESEATTRRGSVEARTAGLGDGGNQTERAPENASARRPVRLG